MCINKLIDVAYQNSKDIEKKNSKAWNGYYGGTKAAAIRAMQLEAPSLKEVMRAIPKECLQKDTFKSLLYAIFSTSLTLAIGIIAYMNIPMELTLWSIPLWIAYAIVEGTVATGTSQ